MLMTSALPNNTFNLQNICQVKKKSEPVKMFWFWNVSRMKWKKAFVMRNINDQVRVVCSLKKCLQIKKALTNLPCKCLIFKLPRLDSNQRPSD